MTNSRKYHIGIIGTGFIARGLLYSLKYHHHLEVSNVLTRRPIKTINNLPVNKKNITHSIDKLIRTSDLVVECTGDVIHGTEMAEEVLKSGLPVVTMNPELQVTTGTILAQMGTFIEAEGDQPGTLAALDAEVKNMGFKPIVYGNIKGFLNLNPALEEMKYWAKRQGISLAQVTGFTDGTKVQVEQALVANGLGATIARHGLAGLKCKNYEDGAQRLGEIAAKIGKPISDYVLCTGGPAGVFIVAKHDKEQASYLKYLKLGSGPHYVIIKPYHLCHLEIAKTITNVLQGDTSYNFNNGMFPTIQVMTIAKRAIKKGEFLERGLGSFVTRGEAVKIHEYPNAVPIGLMHQVDFIRPVKEGQIITFDDIKLPKTRALKMWRQILKQIKAIPDDEVKQPRIRKPRKPQPFPYTKWLPSIRPLAGLNLRSLLKTKSISSE